MAPPSRLVPLLVLAAWPCGCLHIPKNASEPDEPGRYIFVAGMVGSGIEFFGDIWMDCIEAKVCEKRDSTFYSGLMYQQDDEEEFSKSWALRRPKRGKVVPMNLVTLGDRVDRSGFVHPFAGNHTFKGKYLFQSNEDPKLGLYAKVAKKYGDKFKVIVVTRNEKDLLLNVRRKLHVGRRAAQRAAAEVINGLADQVRQLPKGSYRCVRYEDLQKFGFHFQPLIRREQEDTEDFVRDSFKYSKEVGKGCVFGHLNCQKAPILRVALDKLEQLCDHKDLGRPQTKFALSKMEEHEREGVFSSMVRWMMA